MKPSILMIAIAGLILFVTGCGVVVYQHHGWHRHHHHGYLAEAQTLVTEPSIAEQAQSLAADYGIKVETAQKVFFVMTSKTPAQDLAKLNIEQSDIVPLAQMKLPSDQSIHRVAMALGEDDDAIAQIMADYISDLKAEENK